MSNETVRNLFSAKIAESSLFLEIDQLAKMIISSGELIMIEGEDHWYALYEPESDLAFMVPHTRDRRTWATSMFDGAVWETVSGQTNTDFAHPVDWKIAGFLEDFISDMRNQYSEYAE
jgi:hypothetical protein